MTGLTSGAWHIDGTEIVLAGDGSFATTGEDFSGTYVGAPGGWSYGPMRLVLQREGTSHRGLITFTAADGRAEELRVVALHRVRATDPTMQRLDGKLVMWVQDVHSASRAIEPVDPSDLERTGSGILVRRLPRLGPLNVTFVRHGT